MPATKEQIRQIIADNNLNSVADVYSLLKDSFKDILQELMEAELDASLGYEKNQKGNAPTSNKRNGHSPKTLKSQYGEFQIDVPSLQPRCMVSLSDYIRLCVRHFVSSYSTIPRNPSSL